MARMYLLKSYVQACDFNIYDLFLRLYPGEPAIHYPDFLMRNLKN